MSDPYFDPERRAKPWSSNERPRCWGLGPSEATRTGFVEPEPGPVGDDGDDANSRPKIVDLVIADMAEKSERGKAKYGTYLQAHNGRDPLVDCYQELLDACQYMRQVLYEKYGA